jgi:hypothetical protein
MLDRRQLTNGGPLVLEFNERVREIAGARHAIAVTNATLGLQLVVQALGVTGEVIVPAFTFIATPHAMHGVGLRVVFCDVDAVTGNLDPGSRRRCHHTRDWSYCWRTPLGEDPASRSDFRRSEIDMEFRFCTTPRTPSGALTVTGASGRSGELRYSASTRRSL